MLHSKSFSRQSPRAHSIPEDVGSSNVFDCANFVILSEDDAFDLCVYVYIRIAMRFKMD